MLLQFLGRQVLTPSNTIQFLSQPEELDVKDRILVAIFCKAGVSVHIAATMMLKYMKNTSIS
jgi:hypothetical protein